MPLTPQEMADALNANGIDTPEKFVAFIKPAYVAAQLRQKEAELEKLEENFNAARNADQEQHNTAVAALREQIAGLNTQLKG